MKLLHDLFNRGGVLAPLVVITIHVVVLAAVCLLGWLLDPVIHFVGRTVSRFRAFVTDFFVDYDEE